MNRLFEYIIESINWLRIVASPTILGLIVGGVVYLNYQNETGTIIGGIIAIVGLILGIIWATRVWKTIGTTQFFSGINPPPDLDKQKNDNKLDNP